MRTLLRMLQLGPSKGSALLELIIPRCNIGWALITITKTIIIMSSLSSHFFSNYSKCGVSELAQNLSVFCNLRVLEIRENPGVGGTWGYSCYSYRFFARTLFGFFTHIHSRFQCTLASLPRVCSIAATSRYALYSIFLLSCRRLRFFFVFVYVSRFMHVTPRSRFST